jgi:hypothetical protein
MKLTIPPITRPLKLAEYDPAFGEQTLQVWVNQPISKLEHFAAIAREQEAVKKAIQEASTGKKIDKEAIQKAVEVLNRIGPELMEWLTETWSQGPEDTRMDLAAVEELAKACLDQDSGLYSWLVRQTWDVVTSYRMLQKKKLRQAVLDLSEGRGTDEPIMAGMLRAGAINRLLGGAVVTPWEANSELPEDYVDAALMLSGKAQRYQKTRQEIEDVKARIRARRNRKSRNE